MEFRVLVVQLDPVLFVDLCLIDALLGLFQIDALFEHPYHHHSPMDPFVALVEELEGMEWGFDCPLQLEAMTVPPHGFGECAPDPRLESLGHQLLPPNPEKSSVSLKNQNQFFMKTNCRAGSALRIGWMRRFIQIPFLGLAIFVVLAF